MTDTSGESELGVRLRPVGYWRDPDDPRTHGLPDPTLAVDRTWDPSERARVIAYVRTGQEHVACHGYSWCRFKCGIADRRLGNRDLTDGVFVWPEGFAHYLKAHAVKPPAEFIEHVRRQMTLHPPSLVRRLLARLKR
jgi:hypothetical protein